MRSGLPRSPTDAARRGVCLVPADRRRNGLMLEKSILFNISQVFVGAQTGGSWLFRNGPAYARAQRQIDNLKIKARSPWTLANQLSGGNQQKVVIGKWLEIGPKVFLLDDPTRGVDVGAKREIYGLIRKMSADGGIVLFSSTELPELVGLCDRIVVFYQGRIAGELSGVDDHTLLHVINTGEMPAALSRTGSHAMTDTDRACRPMTRRRFRLPEETGVIIALVLMIVIIGIARPRFLNPINLLTILGHTTFQGMLAIGMVYLLAIREIDLSVGWIFNFSAVFSGLLMVAGIDPWIAAFAGVAFGAALGLFNGLLAVGLRLPAIIVTLGTYSMFQGLSLVVNNGRAVVPPDQSSSFFNAISTKVFGIVPVAALVFVVLAIVMHFVLHRTKFGYRVQAVGSNPEAAELAGISNAMVRLQTLVLMGAICGLSGVMYIGFRGAIDPNEGSDFVLVVVAAVIIGGTPLSGGYGTVIGAVVGMLIIQVISSGLIFFGIDATWSTFVTGAVIVVAVVLDQLVKWQRNRALARAGDG